MVQYQRSLVPHLGKEQTWKYLLGIPVKGKLRDFDLYGEFFDDNTKSYYMTGKFSFTGYWRAGRLPNWKFDEAYEFAHEECGIKEKWKRMVIWNRLFDCSKETLERLKRQTTCERKRHVICKLLELKTEVS